MRLHEFIIQLNTNCLLLILLSLGCGVSAQVAYSCQLEPPAWAGMDTKEIVLVNDLGAEVVVNSRIADEFDERTAGFQHLCPEVIDSEFILFVFKRPVQSRFHMQNVHAPLDIAFIAADGTVVNIQTMYPYRPGGSRPLYGPQQPFLYALEAREGFFPEAGISAHKSRLKLRNL